MKWWFYPTGFAFAIHFTLDAMLASLWVSAVSRFENHPPSISEPIAWMLTLKLAYISWAITKDNLLTWKLKVKTCTHMHKTHTMHKHKCHYDKKYINDHKNIIRPPAGNTYTYTVSAWRCSRNIYSTNQQPLRKAINSAKSLTSLSAYLSKTSAQLRRINMEAKLRLQDF